MLGNIFSEESENDVFGLEISDLMVALVAVFLLGTVIMGDKMASLSDGRSINQMHVDSVIKREMGTIAAQFDIGLLDGGTIRYRAQFKSGKSDVTEEMKVSLTSLCPALINVVLQKRNLIRSVTFEGHTSDSWPTGLSSTPYYGNKALSYERATKTMKFCLGENFEFEYPELISKFNAFGFSYTQPLRKKDNSPDWVVSKRVDIIVRAFQDADEHE